MIRAAKGFRMRRSKLYRYASDAVDHGRQYAFRDRKIIADLAATDSAAFAELVKIAQGALKAKSAKA